VAKSAPNAPVVHGGLEKAASSYLQQVVFPNIEGFDYRADLRDHLLALGAAHADHLPSETVDSLAPLRGRRALLSAEGLVCLRRAYTRGMPRDPIVCLFNIRRILGAETRLLMVIRRQDSAVDSMIRYKQRYLADPDSFLVDFPVRRSRLTGVWKSASLTDRLLDSYNYYRHMSLAAEILGRDNVVILVYEEMIEDPARFYCRLGEVFGTNLSEYGQETASRINARSEKYSRLPDGYVPMPHLVRRLNNLTRYRLEKVLPRRRRALTDDRRHEILGIFREDNRRLANMFGLRLGDYGYY
jgi:hypothetical protein